LGSGGQASLPCVASVEVVRNSRSSNVCVSSQELSDPVASGKLRPTFGCRCCVRDLESYGRITRSTERSQRFTDQRECKLCCYDDFSKTSLASRSFVCIPIVCFAKKQRSTRWSLLNCSDIVVVGRLFKQKRVSIRSLFVERWTRGNVLSLSLSRLPLALDVVGK
jgi:hypothetical protein